MENTNYFGQNGVATSAVKFNVVSRCNPDRIEKGFDALDDVLDDVVMRLKKYPSNAIYVNDKKIMLEMGIDGKWSVVLRDDKMKMIAGYVMGKIKRGLADAVAHVLGYVEENEPENEVDMESLANDFNEVMKNKVEEDFKERLDELREFATKYGMKDNSFGSFNYDYVIDRSWVDFADGYGVGADDANEFYRENRELFVNEDDLCELVYGFEDKYGVGIDDNCCGECIVWVKNPNKNAPKNDSPCLDVVKYICSLDDKPTYVKEKDVKVVDEGDKLDIVMFWDYHIEIYKDKRDMCMDGAWCNVGGYGKQDLLFAYEILDNRDEILALVPNRVDIDSIIENALESAMDDGNEYYDDKICQIGDLYVSYTSPCDEFPNGCVCVVDEVGRLYGDWCNVADSGIAVDFLVETLEKYNRVA